MFAQPVQQAPVARRSECANHAEQTAFREHCEKTKSDERWRLQSARGVIVVSGTNRIVKALSLMVLLCRNPAHEPVVKRRHLAKSSGGPVLESAIGLWQRRQNDVALVHRPLTSFTEYSGSSSPYARARFATDRLDQSSRSVSVMGGSTVTIRRAF